MYLVSCILDLDIIMLTSKQVTGNLGEHLARQYLERKNFKIICSNYHTRLGEIDLIAEVLQEVPWLVFIEVKTRAQNNSEIYGHPEELVDYAKQQKILAAANHYLDQKNLNPSHWRLDVIVVELNPVTRCAQIRHFENI